MRFIPLGLSFLFLCGTTFAGDPVKEYYEITAQIQKDVRNQFLEATRFPDSKVYRGLPSTIRAITSKLLALPDAPGMPKIIVADKHSLLAFLYLAEARLYSALVDSGRSPNGNRLVEQRSELARKALVELSEAEKWLLAATDTENSPELGQAIQDSRIKSYILSWKAAAHSILWVLEKNSADKKAARNAWSQIDAGFQSDYGAAAPEVAETLDMDRDSRKSSGMTAISWTGIGLLVVGLLAAIFVSNASAFQQWAVRVIIAIGAAMTATVIPGLLNINIPDYVAAGGALAVIVLIYLFNPPKIEDSRSTVAGSGDPGARLFAAAGDDPRKWPAAPTNPDAGPAAPSPRPPNNQNP